MPQWHDILREECRCGSKFVNALPHRVKVLRNVRSTRAESQVKQIQVEVMCVWFTLLVIMSERLLGPGTFLNGSSLRACCSCIHSTSSSMCLNLFNPLLCTIPMAAFAPIPKLTLSPTAPRSSSDVDIPSASVDARMTP